MLVWRLGLGPTVLLLVLKDWEDGFFFTDSLIAEDQSPCFFFAAVFAWRLRNFSRLYKSLRLGENTLRLRSELSSLGIHMIVFLQ